jgi:hypothetical protein
VDEREFWQRLEFRICAEFQGFEDKRLRRFWRDGIVAEEYDLLRAQSCVGGQAWCGASWLSTPSVP